MRRAGISDLSEDCTAQSMSACIKSALDNTPCQTLALPRSQGPAAVIVMLQSVETSREDMWGVSGDYGVLITEYVGDISAFVRLDSRARKQNTESCFPVCRDPHS